MEKILSKGYAKISKDTPTNLRIWHLPDHGIYLPAKLNKIRVSFDCSAECTEQSINKELVAGPDLTSQIVGILIRFRQEKIAFVADVEKMLFQVLVNNNHRSLFYFLWWQEGDWMKEPDNHEMYVHVIGGLSSPSCRNYAPKRTLILKISLDNFYEDNLIKSVAQEDHHFYFKDDC